MSLRDRICSVYKSPKKDGMYLYVIKHEALKRVPPQLLEYFGRPVHCMDLMLKEGKQLARVDAETVVATIRDQGFYLQMPPGDEDLQDS